MASLKYLAQKYFAAKFFGKDEEETPPEEDQGGNNISAYFSMLDLLAYDINKIKRQKRKKRNNALIVLMEI
jgi:hypothetical protein